ncbi:MAG: ABC transporter permease subunit [Alphaproteobacteria bacterium]|nr:ABC transporter permease subunit [Alphaproteobacteria bacterium]
MTARARRSGWLGQHAAAEGLVMLAVLGWWWMSNSLSAMVLPSPVSVLKRTFDLFVDPELSRHALVTFLRVAGSVFISLVVGLALALLARRAQWIDAIVRDRILVALNALPSVGWAILALIWFKASTLSVMFVQVMILLPFAVTNFMEGLRNLDAEVVEMAHSFTRRRRAVFAKITLPMMLPYGVAALRTSYGICWKIALVAELFGAQSGLGQLMLRAQAAADATTVLATCFAIVVLFAAGQKLVIDPIARAMRADLHQP